MSRADQYQFCLCSLSMENVTVRGIITALCCFILTGSSLGQSANFECQARRGQFADPDNCHIFYQCESNIAYRQFCPPGSLYDGAKNECVNRHEKVKCGPQPTTEPPPSTTPDPNAATPCDPTTCVLPYCFCSLSGTDIPGGLKREETPQMILITFDGAVNVLNFEKYNTIFLKNRTNPNGCQIRATFLMTHDYSDYSKVQDFYSKGHEMAVASISRRTGLENEPIETWIGEMVSMREILQNFANVSRDEVTGMRAPHLKPGRNAQFEVMYDYGFVWDSSMVVPPSSVPVWPYTLDHSIPHECRSGTCPTSSYPGIWELPMNAHFKDTTYEAGYCPYLDQCGFNLYDRYDVLDWLKIDFHRYYDQNRAPYMLALSINWFNTAELHKGLLLFIDYTLSLPDVYYTTVTETLQWITDPQPVNKLSNYAAFDCSQKVLPTPPCKNPKSCPLILSNTAKGVPANSGGSRYMGTCERCPSSYPWIFDAKGFGTGRKDTYQKVEF